VGPQALRSFAAAPHKFCVSARGEIFPPRSSAGISCASALATDSRVHIARAATDLCRQSRLFRQPPNSRQLVRNAGLEANSSVRSVWSGAARTAEHPWRYGPILSDAKPDTLSITSCRAAGLMSAVATQAGPLWQPNGCDVGLIAHTSREVVRSYPTLVPPMALPPSPTAWRCNEHEMLAPFTSGGDSSFAACTTCSARSPEKSSLRRRKCSERGSAVQRQSG
jgi:hypothetical protein